MMATLGGVATDTGGRLAGADVPFTGVSTDSRQVATGELFFALRGEHFDGHEFAADAARRGASGAVVDHELPAPLPQVVVPDTTRALGAAAAAWRRRFTLPLVAVAGSNGKTTTKEMVAAILGRLGPVLATRGTLNNHIGVPVTLFGLAESHRTAVVELGANHPGEVAALTAIAAPTVGLVTNAGEEHLEGFGTVEGAARAEGELFEGLPAGAVAVINADDAFAPLWRRQARAARVVTFGLGATADFRATGVRVSLEDGGFATRFVLECPAGEVPVRLALAGRHNVVNALGAAAAAHAAGAPAEAIAAGLGGVRAVSGRLQFRRALNGAWLIDDSYNANPSSLRAAVDVLGALDGERWLVLGEMAELGSHERGSHVRAGVYAREHGVTRLFGLGPATRHAVEAFGEGARWYADWEALSQSVGRELAPGTTVLVKGSRVSRLERVVAALAAGGTDGAAGGH